MTKIKICCIQNVSEAQMAIDAGADAIGLVSAMPSGPGVVSDAVIQEVSNFAKGKIEIFLLTSETEARKIIHQYKTFKPDFLQLVDYVSRENYKAIRTQIPEAGLVQVIHVTDEKSIELAGSYSLLADRLLLDSGNPELKTKILGGTGKTHNWEISREIVHSVPVPVFLAGGLNPEIANQAINMVNPYGLDICSGLRIEGKLQLNLLTEFVKNVKGI